MIAREKNIYMLCAYRRIEDAYVIYKAEAFSAKEAFMAICKYLNISDAKYLAIDHAQILWDAMELFESFTKTRIQAYVRVLETWYPNHVANIIEVTP